MNKHVKKRLLAASTLALGLALAGAGITQAASVIGTQDPTSNLVSAIATKFKLNSSDVQAVFDEQRAVMEKEHEQAFADRINQAVSDGKLTREQADKIITKRAELEASRESLRASIESKTPTERRDAMKAEMDALRQWATDNDIPVEYMMFGGPGMMGGRHGFDGRHAGDELEKAQ